MIIQINDTYEVCDGCRKRLQIRDKFARDGSFPADWTEKDKLAICPQCSFELFVKFYAPNASVEELTEQLKTVTIPFGGARFNFNNAFVGTTEMATTNIVDSKAAGSITTSLN